MSVSVGDRLYIVRLYSFVDHRETILNSVKTLGDALNRARAAAQRELELHEESFVMEDDGVRRARGEDRWVSITTHDRPRASPAPKRPGWVHCAGREDETRRLLGVVRDQDVITWCGRRSCMEFVFVDASHAIVNGAQEGRLQLCAGCSGAIGKALDQGSYS